MDIYVNLKNNLTALRISHSLTQQALSNLLGIPRANIARYGTGENVPPLDILVKFANYFDVTIDEILV